MVKFEKLSWSAFDGSCRKIARFVRGRRKAGLAVDKVYGIPRGGLGMALRISHLLDIQLIVDEAKVDRRTLVVDEICDTGRTLSEFSKRHRGRYALIATIYHRKDAAFTPDYYLKLKTDKWVLFPWETAKTTRMEDG
ncbi:MAG: hypothetical protein WCX64_00685 [Candidatus Micrarchaeia archaeon]|jgi:hypoxanthine phosphoribosyltransferase